MGRRGVAAPLTVPTGGGPGEGRRDFALAASRALGEPAVEQSLCQLDDGLARAVANREGREADGAYAAQAPTGSKIPRPGYG
jgi:hypothetical protein